MERSWGIIRGDGVNFYPNGKISSLIEMKPLIGAVEHPIDLNGGNITTY
ncbi:hypothetical protein ABDB91_03205 [Desulfoscipio sp. XC116]